MSREFFPHHPAHPCIVRFVSVLAGPAREAPRLPMSFPPSGEWILQVLAREGRLSSASTGRTMKAIAYFAAVDRLFGVPATTCNWNTMDAIVKTLDERRADDA